MKNMMKILSIVIILVGLLLITLEVYGKNVTSILNVRASVPPILKYKIFFQRHFFIITRANIKKGCKRIRRGTIFSVKTNNTNGYIISVNCAETDTFTSIKVKTGSNSVQLLPGGQVEIHEPYPGPHPEIKRLNFKFYLSSDVKPRLYRWPISVTIYPM